MKLPTQALIVFLVFLIATFAHSRTGWWPAGNEDTHSLCGICASDR